MRNFLLLLVFSLLLGCAGIGGKQYDQVKGYKKKKLSMPIKKGTDGTANIINFLKQVKKKGADYVSSFEITFYSDHKSCTTFFLPESELKSKTQMVTKSGKYESKYVYKPVQKYITEQQYKCESKSVPVQRQETYYEQRYDYSSKRTVSSPRTRYVTKYEYKNECKYVSVSRYVTRYEYQLENQYIPPRTEYITKHYTKWKMVETKPFCKKSKKIKNKLAADVYFPQEG
jgi:hypothetical protein